MHCCWYRVMAEHPDDQYTQPTMYVGIGRSSDRCTSWGGSDPQRDTLSIHYTPDTQSDNKEQRHQNDALWMQLELEQGLTSHQTHYRSSRGRIFMDQMTQPTVSEHWRKLVPKDQTSIPSGPPQRAHNNITTMQCGTKTLKIQTQINLRTVKWATEL